MVCSANGSCGGSASMLRLIGRISCGARRTSVMGRSPWPLRWTGRMLLFRFVNQRLARDGRARHLDVPSLVNAPVSAVATGAARDCPDASQQIGLAHRPFGVPMAFIWAVPSAPGRIRRACPAVPPILRIHWIGIGAYARGGESCNRGARFSGRPEPPRNSCNPIEMTSCHHPI